MSTKSSSDTLSDRRILIGQSLQVIRTIQGMTQEDVARDLGDRLDCQIRQGYVSRVEKGNCGVSIERLHVFCDVLNSDAGTVLQVADSLSTDEGKTDAEIMVEVIDAMVSKLPEQDQSLILERLAKMLSRFAPVT